VTSRVHLLKDEAGGYGLAVELHTTLPELTQEDAEALVHQAHAVCPYSRAIRGNVEVTLAARGLRASGAA
jgi:organic hydroperoxide reductase OsmC/OhrA